MESKYLSFNYRNKIIILKYVILCNILLSYKVADYMAYEENFLSYRINLEKDNKNIKLRKLNYRSVNKKMKKKKNNIKLWNGCGAAWSGVERRGAA